MSTRKVMVAMERPSPSTVFIKVTGDGKLTPQQVLDAVSDYLLIDPKELFQTYEDLPHVYIPQDDYDITDTK